MRYRLTKTQVQMLLDGKPLKRMGAGMSEFILPEGKTEVRKALTDWLADEGRQRISSIFLDLDGMKVVEDFR